MDNAFTEAGTAFAIVSPCSKCQNQLSAQGTDGKPFCPRRKWQADQKLQTTASNGNADPTIAPLALFGTEGTPQEGNGALVNPVYWDTSKSSLVWIATVRDNSGVRDADNNVIAPSILDPSFISNHTEWIKCRELPYIPSQHESAARTSGALKEGDQVFAITAQNQQNYSTVDQESNTTSAYQQVMIEGVVTKVNLAYSTPRAKVDSDYVVQGS